LMDGEGVSFIEWAERLGDTLPGRAWRVDFTFDGETGRAIEIRAAVERVDELKERLSPWRDR
jgi:tRNA A37 threonylcarbamoyladenosine biosynthesis protein TsaE